MYRLSIWQKSVAVAVFLSALVLPFWEKFENHLQKSPRILALIYSWKRPIFLSGQVLRLLRQSYPVDISVSVKGVQADFVHEALAKEWAEGLKNGKIVMRISPNRDQFSNFLDTVRDVDLSQYDYFCKIDDDDWYGPDYFKHVSEWLVKEENIAMSYTKENMIITAGENETVVTKSTSPWFGPSMCYSREVVETALWLEQHTEEAETYVEGYPLSRHRRRQEDNYLHKLSLKIGKVQERFTPVWDLSWGWQYPSVTRK